MKTTTTVPFVDLKQQYHELKGEILPALERVMESCAFCLGPEVEALEQEFAAFVGARHAIAMNTGTSALHLALLAAGVEPGDEVITVPMTFVATTAAIGYCGAKPVYVDIHPRSYTMDPALLEGAITEKTRAVLPVHLYGQSADLDPIAEICDRLGVKLIEDACQAHGAEYRGKRVGALGFAGAFSFYPGKNLGAYGEGGMAVTNDDEAARKMRMLRDWGAERKYHHDLPGYNYRMDGMQGAILRIKLRRLEAWTAARQAHAAFYDEKLAGLNLVPPQRMDYGKPVYHLYAVQVEDRGRVMEELKNLGVHTGIHYPVPVHHQPAYRDSGSFPVSESLCQRTMSLPMFPELTREQAQQVVDALEQVVGRKA